MNLPTNPFNDPARAWEYHQGQGFAPARKARMLEVLVRLLEDSTPAGVRVLELGAGTGHLTAKLLEREHFGHIHATDSAPAMLEVARQTLQSERLTLEHLDFSEAAQLERYHTEGIGAVTSSMAFHLAPDKLALFDDIYALLEPDGVLIFADHLAGQSLATHRTIGLERGRVRLGAVDAAALENFLEQDAVNQEKMGNRTESLEMYLAMLYDVGFSDVDCLWRDFWMGILVAKKERS